MFYINHWMNIRSFGGSSKYCGQIYIIIVEVSIYWRDYSASPKGATKNRTLLPKNGLGIFIDNLLLLLFARKLKQFLIYRFIKCTFVYFHHYLYTIRVYIHKTRNNYTILIHPFQTIYNASYPFSLNNH